MWLAYSTIIFFALYLTTVIIIRNHSVADWNKPIILISLTVGLILPLFMGMIFGMYSQMARQELYSYMNDIRKYRARKVGTAVIDFIQKDMIQEAVDLYITMKYYPEKSLDIYLYGMLIARAQKSDVEKLQKVGKRKMDEIKEQFDPAKITF
jgi:hypothetical protein